MSAFITKWYVNGKLELPLLPSGTYDFNIDWGDNTPIQHYTNHYVRHNYIIGAEYIISITGTIKGWRTTKGETTDCRLLDIIQWGCLKLGNKGDYFKGCMSLNISATDAPDLSETTNLHGMFMFCRSLNSPIGHWDVSRVTDMSDMFFYTQEFNQSLNSWNVSKVTTMKQMFLNTNKFNQPLDKWNVSSVTDMTDMFSGAKAFNQPIGSWNVSNVTSMANMFREAKSFNQPLNTWDVSNVKNMRYMFANTQVFNQPIDAWNVANVSDMIGMFEGTRAFNQDISTWDVSSVDDMINFILNTTALNITNRGKLRRWLINRPDLANDLFGMEGSVEIITYAEYTNLHPNNNIESYCAICISEITDKDDWRAFNCHSTVKLGIPHCYHRDCIDGWLASNNICPNCRGKGVLSFATCCIS